MLSPQQKERVRKDLFHCSSNLASTRAHSEKKRPIYNNFQLLVEKPPQVSNTAVASVHCMHTVGPCQELLNKPWSTTDTE